MTLPFTKFDFLCLVQEALNIFSHSNAQVTVTAITVSEVFLFAKNSSTYSYRILKRMFLIAFESPLMCYWNEFEKTFLEITLQIT